MIRVIALSLEVPWVFQTENRCGQDRHPEEEVEQLNHKREVIISFAERINNQELEVHPDCEHQRVVEYQDPWRLLSLSEF